MIKSKRRGAGLLIFLIVAWPLIMVGGAFGIDFSRIIIVTRHVTIATEGAALAGAAQYQKVPCVGGGNCNYYQPWLDGTAAREAVDAYMVNLDLAITNNDVVPREMKWNTVLTPAGNRPTAVRVTTRFVIDDLVFLNYLSIFTGRERFIVDGQVSQEAFTCLGTNAANALQGDCTRPPAN